MDIIKIKTRLTSKSNFNFNNEKKKKTKSTNLCTLLKKHTKKNFEFKVDIALIACASPTRI